MRRRRTGHEKSAVRRQDADDTHLWKVVIRHDDDRASGVKTTAAGAPSHLGVLPGHDVPKAAPVVFPNVREHDTFCWHVHALQRG